MTASLNNTEGTFCIHLQGKRSWHAAFGSVHPKYQTPTAAIILVGIITCFSPLLGKSSLGWFVDASAFGTVVAYFMVALSYVALRRSEPNLERPYKVKAEWVGYVAVLVALFFIYLYVPLGSPNPLGHVEWIMIACWVILGVIFFFMASSAYKGVTKEEREYLVFGDEYSRPGLKWKR